LAGTTKGFLFLGRQFEAGNTSPLQCTPNHLQIALTQLGETIGCIVAEEC
jgi:hypothetical protein